jgi:hypothetical protein
VSVVIDLAQVYDLRGFTLKPLSDLTLIGATAAMVGPPARFIAWVSKDGQTWGKPAGEGEFANIAANRSIQAVRFEAPVSGRYLRFVLPRDPRGAHHRTGRDWDSDSVANPSLGRWRANVELD